MALSIGIVTGSMSRKAGGLFNSVRQSAIALAAAGADVSVYALEDEHSAADRAMWAQLDLHVLPVRLARAFPHAPLLDRMLAAGGHDVVHQHGIWQMQSLSVSRWRRRTGRPVMISPRGMLDPWAIAHAKWKKAIAAVWFERDNLAHAHCLHALNSSEATAMRQFGLTNPVAILPNATELPALKVPGATDEPRTLLFLGRIHPKKGLSELVTAWSIAARQRAELTRRWQLCIAGWDDGGHLHALGQQIAQLGISSSVRLAGPSFGAEKDALLRGADAFILPSFSEGLPMSVLEAWAYGLPVLMTARCNLPEGFRHGAAIEISTDPATMAQSLCQALLDADLPPLGEAGRALVEDRFTWPRIAAQHLAVYGWMTGGGPTPACVETACSRSAR